MILNANINDKNKHRGYYGYEENEEEVEGLHKVNLTHNMQEQVELY